MSESNRDPTMAETQLQAPPPGRPSEESDGSVRLAACRSCSDRFTYISSTGLAVDIVVGIPAPGLKYKAISHVWGPPFVVHMVCQQCLADHSIRIRSRSTFDNVMMLAGPGGTIWMDNMSINQEDHADIAAQVAVMGEIYGNAECVSVLLPESDTEVFDILAELLPMATTLLSRKGQFDYNLADDEWGVDGPLSITETGRIANRFLELIDTFQSKLAETTYWTRAWTFQEWARAHEIEVALDLPEDGRRPVLQKAKSSILYVAIMVIDYAIRKDEYGLMEIDLFRGLAGPKLDQVKRLFPFEDAFATPDEILGHEVLCQTLHPNHMGTNAILGLRGNPRRPRTAEEQFKARVRLMLDAFAGMHRRHATFEADLVCCWASMCNISYDYSKDDPLPVAVAKVSRALRERGLRLYNFTSNRHREQDVDMAFFEYAAAHVQHNATNKAPFPDAPIFSGQADTLKHFATSLAFCHRPHEDIPHAECGDVRIQRVVGAVFAMVTSLSNTARLVPWLLRVTSSGGPDGDCHLFTGLSASIETLIKSLPEEAAKDSKFLVAAVPVSPEHRRKYLHLWAICPKSVLEDEGTLYIGREGLNGTLVVAKESTPDTIVAYLTISDRRCGTFLVPVSEEGRIEILLRTPLRGDIQNSEYLADRKLSAVLELLDPGVGLSASEDWEDTMRYRSTPAHGNEMLIEHIGDRHTVLGGIKRELASRLGGSLSHREGYDRNWIGVTSPAAVQIDIGHPELLPKGLEASDRRKMLDAMLRRRRSLPELKYLK